MEQVKGFTEMEKALYAYKQAEMELVMAEDAEPAQEIMDELENNLEAAGARLMAVTGEQTPFAAEDKAEEITGIDR